MARRQRPEHQSDAPSAQSVSGTLDFQSVPRAAQALRLRRLGMTYEQIAQRCGYRDESGARKAIKAARSRLVLDEARGLVADQLDIVQEALQLVGERIARNDKDSLWAVDRLVPLLKRQAELMGLDAERGEANAQSVTRQYVGVNVEAV